VCWAGGARRADGDWASGRPAAHQRGGRNHQVRAPGRCGTGHPPHAEHTGGASPRRLTSWPAAEAALYTTCRRFAPRCGVRGALPVPSRRNAVRRSCCITNQTRPDARCTPARRSHLNGLLYRTARMMDAGMKPVCVIPPSPPVRGAPRARRRPRRALTSVCGWTGRDIARRRASRRRRVRGNDAPAPTPTNGELLGRVSPPLGVPSDVRRSHAVRCRHALCCRQRPRRI